MSTKIYYQSDTLNNLIDSSSLDREIKEGGISSAIYDGLRIDGDTIQVFFIGSLSIPDEYTLTSIINSHTGEEYLAEWKDTRAIFESTRNPNKLDDGYAGHESGSLWLNKIQKTIYALVDNSPRNAVWVQITNEIQLSQILDGYHPDITGQEHYHQLSDAIQTILNSLDGYITSSGTDTKVKVSATDTTSGYLSEKLIEGPGITLTTKNSGGDEKLEASITPGILDGYGEASLPQPTCCGQVLYSIDGNSFTAQLPLTSTSSGWLVNDNGILLVVG